MESQFEISTDQTRLDLDFICEFLKTSYWASGRRRSVVERAIRNSLCFGVYEDGRQVAFARVVSDRSRFSYLCDVFVVAEQRGRGLGRALIDFVLAHPSVRDTRRMLLGTRDAHPFYERMGWKSDDRGRFMERLVESPG